MNQRIKDKIKELEESVHVAWTTDEVIDILESLYEE